MDISLDFRIKRSICDQLQDGIRAKIQAGHLLPGDQLPAVREVAAALGINFNTVARAYRALDHQGWISTQQGRGTFVLCQPSALANGVDETPHEILQDLLDRFLSDVSRLDIPEYKLWATLKQRAAQRDKGLRQPLRRLPRRESRKPMYHPPVFVGTMTSTHTKKNTKKR